MSSNQGFGALLLSYMAGFAPASPRLQDDALITFGPNNRGSIRTNIRMGQSHLNFHLFYSARYFLIALLDTPNFLATLSKEELLIIDNIVFLSGHTILV